MTRRTIGLLIIVALALLLAPLGAAVPRPANPPRIGWLASGFPPADAAPPQAPFLPFLQGLRDLGWVEGQNLAIEPRYAQGQYDRLHELAAELVQLGVDVIVVGDSAAIPAAKLATSTIPIVVTVSSDPVGRGLVASLARPGGNITGLTNMSPNLAEKRLTLLKEALPGLARVAVLGPSPRTYYHSDWDELIRAAQPLGVQLRVFTLQHPNTFAQAFTAAKNEHADALVVLPAPLTNRHRTRLVSLAAMHQLPAMYALKEYVEDGGLMAYGPSIPDLYRRAATYVDKILKGAKPADLPVEQPMKFELVINLKTAQALGLTVPPSLLFQADEVIR